MTVEISTADDASNYADYPKDRPDSYSFVVGGDAASSIMSADTLQNAMATKKLKIANPSQY